ncbi:MAG: UDPGP type 1 family protein [Ruminococcaceae bacterium]|nr:UDPGP type 1 family protein [Oscillospiraceae bacterium]
MEKTALNTMLQKNKQEHLLPYVAAMTEEQAGIFEAELSKIDFAALEAITEESPVRGTITPIEAYTLQRRALEKEENLRVGIEAIKSGRLATVMLAGGQGTRLGSDKPKGCYNVGITREYYLFEAHVEKLIETEKKYGVKLPLYIMTSEKNHEQTVAFFETHEYFGYGKENIGFFRQKSAPCTDFNRKLLMESTTRLASSPNGNGGWYVSLAESDCGKEMRERGIEWISLFGVDNPLQRFCCEEFIGASVRANASCAVKVVTKAYPEELMGVMCLEDGKPSMIAYAEMTDALRYATDENGNLLYTYGDILNMIFRVDELDRCMGAEMPIHIARKKIPYVDADGTAHSPTAPNGFKYEQFLFDAFRYMSSVFLFEVERSKEFAPIKNLTGADSVESARRMLTENGVTL